MSHTRSPVLTLESAIAGAPYRIAPEREKALAADSHCRDASIVITDGTGFTFQVSPTSKEVTTTVATLEYLWCCTHAHLVLYDEYSKAQRRREAQFDSGGNPRSRAALDLLNWSISNLQASGTAVWPPNLPRPERYPGEGTDIHVANELFLCATAWVLHHELAHLRLGHQPFESIRSIVEEREADLEATRWILQESNVDAESGKRTVGIAAAILALQTIPDSAKTGLLRTHPATFERIDYCLSAANLADDDEVYAFAACMMQIQLASRGKNFAPEASSFRDLFSEYLFAFAKWDDSERFPADG